MIQFFYAYSAESNPWTSSAFTNPKHLFRDEDAPGSPSSRRQLGGSSGLNNWSNDLFARKIRHYANYKGLSYGSGNSCSIIAHSQGGLAAVRTMNNRTTRIIVAKVRGHIISILIQSCHSSFQTAPLVLVLLLVLGQWPESPFDSISWISLSGHGSGG